MGSSVVCVPHRILLVELQIKTDERSRACGIHVEEEWCIQCVGSRTDGKRPIGRTRHRHEYNILS
jgi:hypothetical protein